MRNLLLTLGLLATLMASACVVDSRPLSTSSSQRHDPWRHTAQGWERNTLWDVQDEPVAAQIHPGLVASFQVLACVGGLLATEPHQASVFSLFDNREKM